MEQQKLQGIYTRKSSDHKKGGGTKIYINNEPTLSTYFCLFQTSSENILKQFQTYDMQKDSTIHVHVLT